MNKIRSFISDDDGFSAKDFLMILFVGAYIIEQVIVFILSIMGKINPDTLGVVRSLDTIVLTIVGGVFSVQAVREFRKPNDDTFSYEYKDEVEQQTDDTYQK